MNRICASASETNSRIKESKLMHKKFQYVLILIALVLFLAACGTANNQLNGASNNSPQQDTDSSQPAVPTPIPTSLVVCLGEQPNTLFPYGSPNQTAQTVLQAIYDGPIDNLGYQYQPILVETLPGIADQTAVIQKVQVAPGDTVVDNQGNVLPLEFGDFIRPSDCFSADCAVAFDGNPVEMDQMVALFTLRQGITWSDGTPITAQDSVYGFTLNADPDTPADKFRTERTLSYEALEGNLIKWTGIPGYIDQQYQNNFWQPAPQHAWGELPPAQLPTAAEAAFQPLSFGPFIVSSFAAEQIVLQRNSNYFRVAEGLPLVDQVIFRVVGQDPETNLDMLRTGECDLLDPTATRGINITQIAEADAEGLQTSWATGSGWQALYFGITPQSYDDGYSMWAADRADFFGDARTRQAVALCINREQIAAQLTLENAGVMDSYVTDDHPLNNSNVPVYDYDPARAAELLDAVGWVLPNGASVRIAQGITDVFDDTVFSIEYFYSEHPQNEVIAGIIAQNLADCGIEVTLKAMAAEELFATGEDSPLFGRNFDLAHFSWQASSTPACHLFFSDAIPGEDLELFPYKWGGWNAAGWSNDEFDAACRSARGSAPGQDSYAQSHAQAQQIFAEELPVIPLYAYQQVSIARSDLCGLQLDPTGGLMWNVENIAYGVDCP
jgi:peptide/nickel transport system substrate-binding protein